MRNSTFIAIAFLMAVGCIGLGFWEGRYYQSHIVINNEKFIYMTNSSCPQPLMDRCSISYDLAPIDAYVFQVENSIPSNGTNCLPRALMLQELLEDNGYNSVVQVGMNNNMTVGHAWVELNMDIFGSRKEFPIHYPPYERIEVEER
jgi:hypothetical protein